MHRAKHLPAAHFRTPVLAELLSDRDFVVECLKTVIRGTRGPLFGLLVNDYVAGQKHTNFDTALMVNQDV